LLKAQIDVDLLGKTARPLITATAAALVGGFGFAGAYWRMIAAAGFQADADALRSSWT
jgi:hypothetical protein